MGGPWGTTLGRGWPTRISIALVEAGAVGERAFRQVVAHAHLVRLFRVGGVGY